MPVSPVSAVSFSSAQLYVTTMGYEQIKLIYNFFKTIISVKTIMFMRLLGGLYYKISSNRMVCVIVALYCVAVCSFITSSVFEILVIASPAVVVKAVTGLTTYYSCVIISLLTGSLYFDAYLTDMETIDILLGVRPDIDVPVSRLLFLADITFELSVTLPFYWFMVEDGASASAQINFFKLSYFVLSCDLTSFTRIMMFELLWTRVRKFRQYLVSTLSRASTLQGSEDARNSMRQCMLIYKKIMDTIKKLGIPVKSIVCSSFLLPTLRIFQFFE